MNGIFAAADNPIRFEIIDALRLREIYGNMTRRRVAASNVSFPNRLLVPSVSGVAASYIGVMNCKEYVDKIVRDTITGELNQNLAIDNVRLFLGDEGVNKEIAETLRDNAAKKEFMLLNNGITIVAEDAHVPANPSMSCDIFNYRIVNGWQTTNALWDNYGHLDDYTYVPVKLVVTGDRALTDRIVRATHRQTPVSESQFLALNSRQLQLEDTYSTPPTGFDLRKINYLRQVSADHLHVDGPTIDIVSQMECYVSMFMGQPHQANTVRYGELLRGNDNLTQYNTVFHDDHPDDFFYVAGYTLCEAEDFIRDLYEERGSSSTPAISFDEMMNYKHHLLFLFRIMQTKDEPLPKANSIRGVQAYRDGLLTVLSDKTKKDKAFHDAVSVLAEGLKWFDGQNHEFEARRWAGFTAKLTEIAKSGAATADVSRQESQANPCARSVTAPQTSSTPATNNPAAGNAQQQTPAPPPPSQPMPNPRISPDDNVLTCTIAGFVETPSQRSNWLVYVSTSDGEIKTYDIARRDVGMWKLSPDNALGKVIYFRSIAGQRNSPRAQILDVVS